MCPVEIFFCFSFGKLATNERKSAELNELGVLDNVGSGFLEQFLGLAYTTLVACGDDSNVSGSCLGKLTNEKSVIVGKVTLDLSCKDNESLSVARVCGGEFYQRSLR